MPSRRKSEAGVLSPNLTPLLDVVLQLITFFMMLIHFGSRIEASTRAVRLPVAPAALPGGDLALDRLVVALDEQGKLIVEDRTYEGDAASAWWKEEAARRRGGLETLRAPAGELSTIVVVRADKRASYGAVRRTLAAAQERGFAHFSLVVLRRPER